MVSRGNVLWGSPASCPFNYPQRKGVPPLLPPLPITHLPSRFTLYLYGIIKSVDFTQKCVLLMHKPFLFVLFFLLLSFMANPAQLKANFSGSFAVSFFLSFPTSHSYWLPCLFPSHPLIFCFIRQSQRQLKPIRVKSNIGDAPITRKRGAVCWTIAHRLVRTGRLWKTLRWLFPNRTSLAMGRWHQATVSGQATSVVTGMKMQVCWLLVKSGSPACAMAPLTQTASPHSTFSSVETHFSLRWRTKATCSILRLGPGLKTMPVGPLWIGQGLHCPSEYPLALTESLAGGSSLKAS